MIINDLYGCYIVFDTKNRNMELDTLFNNTKCISPNIWKYAKNNSIFLQSIH